MSGLAAAAVLPACGSGAGAGGASGADGGASALTRPLLRPWADDLIWLDAPADELPVAYVSMALRQVFVDHDFRDRASWLLDAHISVSTAHWRIRLPGDPPGEPIAPGDSLREFEELSMRDWDPAMPPAMDDIRIRRGRALPRMVDFRCVPVIGMPNGVGAPNATGVADETWCSAGPWTFEAAVRVGADGQTVTRPDGPSSGAGGMLVDDTVREDFGPVGVGLRYSERSCAGDGDAVQLLTWARRGA